MLLYTDHINSNSIWPYLQPQPRKKVIFLGLNYSKKLQAFTDRFLWNFVEGLGTAQEYSDYISVVIWILLWTPDHYLRFFTITT